MGGSTAFDYGCESSVPSTEVRTVVLVGKTGNGKSSTGNSIIGRRAFKSKASSAGVTSTCELQSTELEDGKILNVIDTPGLFDFSAESESIGKEIVKCIDMARDGIHALLVVLSVRSRFSREEEACIQSLRNIFGAKISDYMILLFTGGDDLARDGETLDGYLGGPDCPENLKEIIQMCDTRRLLFDNGTSDDSKKSLQLKQLLFLVNKVVEKNGGKPFTNELFVELKSEAKVGCSKLEVSESTEQFQKSHEDQLKRITEMIEWKLKDTMDQLRQQLADERAARLEAEAKMEASQQKSKDKIDGLKEDLETARRETEHLRQKAERIHCAIM